MPKNGKSKTKVDKKQTKDIAMLKRMLPTQAEQYQSKIAVPPSNDGDLNEIFTPVNNERLQITKLNFRANVEFLPTAATNAEGVFIRYILFRYKCDVSAGAVVDPIATDVMNYPTGNEPNVNLLPNINNSKRVKFLMDKTVVLQSQGHGSNHALVTYKKTFKKPIQHMAIKDRAFVHRIYCLVIGSNASSQSASIIGGVTQGYNILTDTVQLP
jgi:hypothetical protein